MSWAYQYKLGEISLFYAVMMDWFWKKTEEAKDLHGVHIGPYQKSLPQRLILSAKNKNLRTYLTIIRHICFECRRPPTYT